LLTQEEAVDILSLVEILMASLIMTTEVLETLLTIVKILFLMRTIIKEATYQTTEEITLEQSQISVLVEEPENLKFLEIVA